MPKRGRDLAGGIANTLRQRIIDGEFRAGDKLPSEAALCQEFEVSRPTLRVALKQLDALGLVRTQHGVGTFVTESTPVRSGLERLTSITQSIREAGKTPGMVYASRTRRLLMPDEARRMGMDASTEVYEYRRRVTADGQTVAYSYDLLPQSLLPAEFDVDAPTGSLFEYLATEYGIVPVMATAEVHAVYSDHVGWGQDAEGHDLFLLLDQIHYAADDLLVMYSRTYFVEGAYSFEVIRRLAHG